MSEHDDRLGSLTKLRRFEGGVVVGLAVNAISDAYKGAGPIAIGAALLFVVTVAVELRRFPARAPIQRLVARTCLGVAAVAAVGSLLVPPSWTGWVVLAAVATGLASCLVPTSSNDVYNQLHLVSLIGICVALVGNFAAASGGAGFDLQNIDSPVLYGFMGIFTAMGILATHQSLRLRGRVLVGVFCIGCSIAGIVGGISYVSHSRVIHGAVAILVGLGGIGGSLSVFLASRPLFGVAVIGGGLGAIVGGLGAIVGGLTLPPHTRVLLGAALILFGVATIGSLVPAAGLKLNFPGWRERLLTEPPNDDVTDDTESTTDRDDSAGGSAQRRAPQNTSD